MAYNYPLVLYGIRNLLLNSDFNKWDNMMIKHNPNNERIKRKYLIFMQEAKRLSVPTIDSIAKSLSRFELIGG